MSATDAIGLERMEALLRGDAPRTPAEQRRSALLDELRETTLHAPDALRARVLAPRPAPRGFALPRLRLALVAAPAALALALAAAALHGVTRPERKVATPAPVPMVAHGKSAADSTRAMAPAGGGAARLSHTDASLTVRVPDRARLAEATARATRIATSLGGYAQSVSSSNPATGNATSYLELRVPALNVERAIAKLGGLGTLVSQEVSTKDLERDLAVESEQIAQLRRRVAAYEAALRNPSLPEAQRVILRVRLAESKRALAQRLAARKGTIAAAATSRISVVLRAEDSAAAPAPRGRLARMLDSAIRFLALEGVVALYVLIVISPFALAGAGWWGFGRLRRRRDEQRLLMT